MNYRNILVIGGGAIGGIVAAVLTQKGEQVIVVDSDKEHVKKMNQGLLITGHRELKIPVSSLTADEMLAGQYRHWADIVLLSVKGLFTEAALTAMLPVIKDGAPVVSMQNGVNEDTIAAIVGEKRTIGCSITWGSTNVGPGHLMQTTEGGFIIGLWPTGKSRLIEDVADILGLAFPTEISDNIIGDRWTKLLITASFTGVGTCAGLTYGGIIDNEAARKAAIATITETYHIGKALGVSFASINGISPEIFIASNRKEFEEASKILELGFAKHRAIQPSMWQDIEKGRKTEVDFVNGYVVTKAGQINRAAPINALVTRFIHEIEQGGKSPALSNLGEFDNLIAHLNV
jgi:2-dehydropantoate 2-reductase